MSKEITIPIKIDDEDIKKLEKIKQLLIDIKEIDNEFKISNVINVDNNTTLILKNKGMLRTIDAEEIEEKLSKKLNCRCVILNPIFNLETAIKKETDKKINCNEKNEVDYVVETYFADNKPYKEIRKYYKHPPID